MSVSEYILFAAAKRLYRTNISQPSYARKSTVSKDESSRTRSEEFEKILAATKRFSIDLVGKSVLDFGCNNGALTVRYLDAGAGKVTGVDINESAIESARKQYRLPNLTFLTSNIGSIPIQDNTIDVVISFDVFEHVSDVHGSLAEIYRVTKPGGQALLGVCGGWHHPFAPHLRAVMPVPWAHVIFSEKTVLSVCRKVYRSNFYTPQHYDFDSNGTRIDTKYSGDRISTTYLNKYLLKDFESALEQSKFDYEIHLIPFGYKLAKALIIAPWFRELFTGYAWFVLKKPPMPR